MIVLFGTSDDPILDTVSSALTRRNACHRLIDQRCPVPALATGNGRLSTTTLDGQRISGVVLRPAAVMDVAVAQAWDVEGCDTQALAQFTSEFLARCEFEPWLVVNRLSVQASNLSKPWQLDRIRSFFDVPATLLSTDPQRVAAFARHHGRTIVKSVSAVRSIVREVANDIDFTNVTHCPTLFQERIEGADVRVHVVGEETFATKMTSTADDYRYDSTTAREPLPLSGDVSARCVALSKSLGLVLSGIDFRVTPDGRWVCFEVNPSPAFTYFEPWPEAPIADALATFLVNSMGD